MRGHNYIDFILVSHNHLVCDLSVVQLFSNCMSIYFFIVRPSILIGHMRGASFAEFHHCHEVSQAFVFVIISNSWGACCSNNGL